MALPLFAPRASNCPDLTTEDNHTPIVEGMRLFNYYDGKWGTVGRIYGDDGWFTFTHDDGTSTQLNGVRVSTVEPPKRAY
jgi:hypothetical protein